MRAVRLIGINELSVADKASSEPAGGEVRIRLKAAALNHRDLWIKIGQYPGIHYPLQPGSDGAGIVETVGFGVDTDWVGREVIVNPGFAWGENEAAQGDRFNVLGMPRDGTFAEELIVPDTQLAEKPAHLSLVEAAALPLAGLTAYRALFSRAKLQAGETVLISGIGGGVALMALKFAVAKGAHVYVTSSSDEKIARAITLGAKGGFNYTHAGWAATAVHAKHAFDVVLDSAGGDGLESLLDLATPGGRVVLFGATRGNPSTLPVRKVFSRQLSLIGTMLGSYADWDAMVKFVNEHKIVPVVSKTFALEDVGSAFDLMERGEQFGKIVLTA